jgi:mono/diheme cytochrome c family protein
LEGEADMREQWAKRVAIVTGLAVVGLSALIATRFDVAAGEGETPAAVQRVAADPAQVARGRVVYQEEGCAGCHAVGGEGNPRIPLDGIGARLDAEQLLHWTIAAPEVAEQMPRRTAMMKQGYADLDQADLDALMAYLGTLR